MKIDTNYFIILTFTQIFVIWDVFLLQFCFVFFIHFWFWRDILIFDVLFQLQCPAFSQNLGDRLIADHGNGIVNCLLCNWIKNVICAFVVSFIFCFLLISCCIDVEYNFVNVFFYLSADIVCMFLIYHLMVTEYLADDLLPIYVMFVRFCQIFLLVDGCYCECMFVHLNWWRLLMS